MRNSWNSFLSSIVFISRIPIKINFEYRADKENVKFFPMVGIILGLIVFSLSQGMLFFFDNKVTSVFAVFLIAILTGGIHLDGLSDMADGLFSYRGKEDIIKIMKDSRIGAMGVLSLLFILFFKIVFLNFLLDMNMKIVILIFPLLGRLGIVNACYLAKPIEESRLGLSFIGQMNKNEFLRIYGFYYIFLALLLLPFNYDFNYAVLLGSICLTMIINFIIVRHIVATITRKIDGISGDILGGVCEIMETISLPLLYLGVWVCKKLI